LSDEQRIVFSAALAASRHPGVLLLDSHKSSDALKNFLASYGPDRVLPVGSFPEGISSLEERLDMRAAAPLTWKQGPPVDLWRTLFPRAEQVVVSPAEPRELLLQSACLAGALHAPLFVEHQNPGDAEELARWLGEWHTRQVYAVGEATRVCKHLSDVRLLHLRDAQAVSACYLRHLHKDGPIRNLVVANPADGRTGLENLSTLAPWIAIQKRAVLLLTDTAGTNAEGLVNEAVKNPVLKRADNVVLVAGLKALPMQRRPNPLPADKDTFIEMEPLTPTGTETYSFAIGRLFHDDPAVVPLMLARQRLLAEARGPRRALIASNPGGGLPLLEAFSRNTAKELHNAGYQTTSLFGKDVGKDELRRMLPENHLFLWEGHHNTLIKDWAMPEWTEPLPPSFVFLQSCLALADWKALPLLQRGAVGVVGTSTRTYSASGGACSLAFFDAILYEDQSLGGALRQAKNFLLAYSLLKEKRLGKEAKRGGANLRSAWAFTLWGDPTLKLPRPEAPADRLPPVRHTVHGNTIVLTLPETLYSKVTSTKYQVQMAPNARLAGLLRKDSEHAELALAPFVFVEVSLPNAPEGTTPRLHSRIPGSNYVFCWDQRRRSGYLLVTPRAKDQGELRFHVDWESADVGETEVLIGASGQ